MSGKGYVPLCPGGDGGDREQNRNLAAPMTKKGFAFWYEYECQQGHSHIGGAA